MNILAADSSTFLAGGFWSGVLSSIIGSVIIAWFVFLFRFLKTKSEFSGLSGYWFEEIKRNNGVTEMAIGQMIVDRWSAHIHYNGTNYGSDGKERYGWQSQRLFIDKKHENVYQIYYIYKLSSRDHQQDSKDGFGKISLEFCEEKRRWRPTRGFFVDADSMTETCNVSMQPFANVVAEINRATQNEFNSTNRAAHERILEILIKTRQ